MIAQRDAVAPPLPLDSVLHGDCLSVLRSLPDACCDAIVTDPPAGISFMGKGWDSDKGGRDQWIAWLSEVMREALRVVKPGGHALVWALPRTSHWTGMALEDAGWEVRDKVAHWYGSGFPKSLDVGKAIDKRAGAQREVVGHEVYRKQPTLHRGEFGSRHPTTDGKMRREWDVTAPATDAASAWDGWGTALKPAYEDWWLVRKPLAEKTIAANVLAHGTGALHIAASRVGYASDADKAQALAGDAFKRKDIRDKTAWARPWMEDTARVDRMNAEAKERAHAGRWPPNLLLSHADDCLEGGPCSLWCPVRALDAQSGVRPGSHHQKPTHSTNAAFGGGRYDNTSCYADSGGASRFFPTFRYVAKAGRSERNRGCEEIEAQRKSNYAPNDPNENKLQTRLHGSVERRGNHHPTIKPLALMSWLITLITPPGGIVLDPFAGSGSTLCAAKAGGWRYLGIEREAEYVAIAEARLEAIK